MRLSFINYNLFFESIIIVTGPSFNKLTFISDPKIPEATFRPDFFFNLLIKLSNNFLAFSGLAAKE